MAATTQQFWLERLHTLEVVEGGASPLSKAGISISPHFKQLIYPTFLAHAFIHQ